MSVFDKHKDGEGKHDSFYRALANKDYTAAVKAYEEAKSNLPQIKADEVLVLAKAAKEVGKYKLALEMIEGFSTQYPEHQDVVSIYLLVADILANHLVQKEAACQLLEHLSSRYPSSNQTNKIAEALTLLTITKSENNV